MISQKISQASKVTFRSPSKSKTHPLQDVGEAGNGAKIL